MFGIHSIELPEHQASLHMGAGMVYHVSSLPDSCVVAFLLQALKPHPRPRRAAAAAAATPSNLAATAGPSPG